jgi:hypothetical protein
MYKVRTNFQNLRMGFEGTAAAILGEMRTGIYPTWIAAITSMVPIWLIYIAALMNFIIFLSQLFYVEFGACCNPQRRANRHQPRRAFSIFPSLANTQTARFDAILTSHYKLGSLCYASKRRFAPLVKKVEVPACRASSLLCCLLSRL